MKYTDAQSRELILSDFQHTLFVEAGAGSGKTTSLVSRILMLILKGFADIREIAAITFTNEGAASLRSKIQRELERVSALHSYRPVPEIDVTIGAEEQKRLNNALAYLPLAQFSTIHSFCVRLLKERPVEAGLDPKFELNPEANVISAISQAWIHFLIGAAQKKHPFLAFALDEGISFDDIQTIAEVKKDNPDLELYTEHVSPVTDKQIDSAFRKISNHAQEMHDHRHELQGGKSTQAATDRLRYVENLHKTCLAVPSTQKMMRDFLAGLPSHDDWTGKQGFFSEHANAIAVLCASIRKKHLDYVHSRIAAFVIEFEKFFEDYRKATSSLEYQDLLYIAWTILKEKKDVRQYFKQKYKYLLIDETQDVDPLQIEIVFFLAECNTAFAASWDKVQLEPSKLFMVGDPKQSIYKFRRADIAVYEEAKQCIAEQGGRLLTLSKNFRSAPEIIQFVNQHFSHSFETFKEAIRLRTHPAYEPLLAASVHNSSISKNIVVITSPEQNPKARKHEKLKEETEKICSLVHSLTAPTGPEIVDPDSGETRHIACRDIMILLRSFTGIAEFTSAFEESNIPYQEVGGRTFFQTDDIRGIVWALKAIDDPTNTVTLFGALKSPLVGVTDQALFDHVSSGKRLNIFSGDEAATDSLNKSLTLLKNLHQHRETLRPSGVVQQLYDHSGVCHIVLDEPNGLQKSSKFIRLLELVREVEQDHTRSFRSVVSSLEYVMTEVDDPKMANLTISRSGEDAVRVTTIHGAKGLESPVVILADATVRHMGGELDKCILRNEGKIIISYQGVGGFYSKDIDQLTSSEQLRDDAESERLRYVAATRARDMLVLCIPAKEQKGDSFNGRFSHSIWNNTSVDIFTPRTSSRKSRTSRGQTIDLAAVFRTASEEVQSRLLQSKTRVSTFLTPFKSVHDLMEIDPDLFKQRRKSRGLAFGVVLHRLMQHVVAHEHFDQDAVIDQWMEEDSVPVKLRQELLDCVAALCEDPVIKAARASKEKYTEWEFFITRDGTIVNGVIDLVFKDHVGLWTIVDYKTDDVSDPVRKAKLDELYGAQLRQYARAFSETTGFKVSSRRILYSK